MSCSGDPQPEPDLSNIPRPPAFEVMHPDLSLRRVLDDRRVGLITDLALWESDRGPVVGVAGNLGIALLTTDGALIETRPISRPQDAGGTFGNFHWIDADRQGAPELLSLEELLVDSVMLLNGDGSTRWRWTLPDGARAPFGLGLVYPFRNEAGELRVAVWTGIDHSVYIIDHAGRTAERPVWGKMNAREAVVRLGVPGGADAMLVYGSEGSLRVRDGLGRETAKVDLPRPNRFVNGIVPLRSDPGSLEFLVNSTYGPEEQRQYLVRLPAGQEPTVTPLTDAATARAALARRTGTQLDLLGTGEPVWAQAGKTTVQGGFVGLAGVWAAVEVRSGGVDLYRTVLPRGDLHARHLFEPTLLAVPRPAGGEDLWVAWGSRLSRVGRGRDQ